MTLQLTTTMMLNLLAGLSPTERWQSAGRFSESWISGQWLFVSLFVALMLLLLLIAVSIFFRITQKKKAARLVFVNQLKQKGFDQTELQILKAVADHCGLKNKSAILNIEGAFNHGANVIIQKAAEKYSVEKSKELEAILKKLKEKLGFISEKPQQTYTAAEKGKSTRKIPAGTKIYITRRMEKYDNGLESELVENSDRGLKIRPKVKVRVAPGDKWQVSYAYGASIWSFESRVLDFEEDCFTIAHSKNIQFVFRKRFPAVKLRRNAQIADFPFLETLQKQNGPQDDTQEAKTTEQAPDNKIIEPIFFPAVVTEIAGPWIKLETSENIEANHMVLITFILERNNENEVVTKVRAFGELKRKEKIENGFLLAVELKGYEDNWIEDFVGVVTKVSLEELSEQKEQTQNNEEQAVAAVAKEEL